MDARISGDLDGLFEATGAQGISLRNLSDPNVDFDQSLGLNVPWNSHPKLHWILDSDVNILVLMDKCNRLEKCFKGPRKTFWVCRQRLEK